MANTVSAKKRIRQSKKRNIMNKSRRSAAKTQIKKVMEQVEKGDAQKAQKELDGAYKLIDKCARHNTWHPKKAARMKSQLARKVKSMK